MGHQVCCSHGKSEQEGHLTENTTLRVCQACVLGTLLRGSEAWTTRAGNEKHLNSFHLWCLKDLQHVRRQDHVTNSEALQASQACSQKRLGWLGQSV